MCPLNGHCQTFVRLTNHGGTIARTSFQQVPGTFRYVNFKSKKIGKAIRSGRSLLEVEVRQHRIGGASARFSAPLD